MPHDPQKLTECRSWLERAQADLESASILLAADRPRRDTAMFHCQQAAEKAWKAFLFWNDTPFRKTHNLRELGGAAVRLDRSLTPLAERAEDLTQFEWIFRYPGEQAQPEREEADGALALARQVYEAVLFRVPPEARP